MLRNQRLVMNYRLWQREFGGNPKILNTTFILNGKVFGMVGMGEDLTL